MNWFTWHLKRATKAMFHQVVRVVRTGWSGTSTRPAKRSPSWWAAKGWKGWKGWKSDRNADFHWFPWSSWSCNDGRCDNKKSLISGWLKFWVGYHGMNIYIYICVWLSSGYFTVCHWENGPLIGRLTKNDLGLFMSTVVWDMFWKIHQP